MVCCFHSVAMACKSGSMADRGICAWLRAALAYAARQIGGRQNFFQTCAVNSSQTLPQNSLENATTSWRRPRATSPLWSHASCTRTRALPARGSAATFCHYLCRQQSLPRRMFSLDPGMCCAWRVRDNGKAHREGHSVRVSDSRKETLLVLPRAKKNAPCVSPSRVS